MKLQRILQTYRRLSEAKESLVHVHGRELLQIPPNTAILLSIHDLIDKCQLQMEALEQLPIPSDEESVRTFCDALDDISTKSNEYFVTAAVFESDLHDRICASNRAIDR